MQSTNKFLTDADTGLAFLKREDPYDKPLRRIVHREALSVIYMEVQKSGCSTIKYMLYQAESQTPIRWKKTKQTVIEDKDRMVDLSGEQLVQLFQDTGSYLFTFVRNPYQRLFSCWADKFYSWLVREDFAEEDKPEKIAFIQSRLGLTGDNYRLSFEEFVDRVCEQDESEMDKHWMPQYRMIGADVLKYDLIGKLESFDRDIAKIEVAIGKKLPNERHLNKKSGMVDIDELMTGAVKSKIAKKYECDFDTFGYTR